MSKAISVALIKVQFLQYDATLLILHYTYCNHSIFNVNCLSKRLKKTITHYTDYINCANQARNRIAHLFCEGALQMDIKVSWLVQSTIFLNFHCIFHSRFFILDPAGAASHDSLLKKKKISTKISRKPSLALQCFVVPFTCWERDTKKAAIGWSLGAEWTPGWGCCHQALRGVISLSDITKGGFLELTFLGMSLTG